MHNPSIQNHIVKVALEKDTLVKHHQLAWKLAAVASDHTPIDTDVADMVINRIIDNAAVAIASLNRSSVVSAREMALAHPRQNGATVFGMPNQITVCAEWACWVNGTAVRELDYHDTFLAAEYSHPGDNIPPILAVAQQKHKSGADILKAIATAYELHVNLVKGICLHKHKIDHIAHIGPATAGGLGTLLHLDTEVIYQAIQQALHVTCTTRQSRKGDISTWKAYAPAHATKLAIEAVDRCMRGQGAPSPIYEGEESVLASMLDGFDSHYTVPLPAMGTPKRAILETYTKQHSAEYQAQAIIDMCCALGEQVAHATGGDWSQVKQVVLHTSHHTHYVIGTGANDPQKSDPHASRETLDHSIMYIIAVALQDRTWHHVESYAPSRAHRADTVALWHKITTVEDKKWTQRYHATDPNVKAFGGRLEITLNDGTVFTDEMAVANAHPLGRTPWGRSDYIDKFNMLTANVISDSESQRFLDLVQRLPTLTAAEVTQLNVAAPLETVLSNTANQQGIF